MGKHNSGNLQRINVFIHGFQIRYRDYQTQIAFNGEPSDFTLKLNYKADEPFFWFASMRANPTETIIVSNRDLGFLIVLAIDCASLALAVKLAGRDLLSKLVKCNPRATMIFVTLLPR